MISWLFLTISGVLLIFVGLAKRYVVCIGFGHGCTNLGCESAPTRLVDRDGSVATSPGLVSDGRCHRATTSHVPEEGTALDLGLFPGDTGEKRGAEAEAPAAGNLR
jgi:hypothetical protein